MVIPLMSPIDMPLNHIQPSCRVEFLIILLLVVLYPIYITNLASYIIIILIKCLLLVSYKPCISPLRTHEMSLYPTKSHRNPMNIPFYHHFGWSEHYGYIPFISKCLVISHLYSKFGYISFISKFYHYILVIFHFGWLRSHTAQSTPSRSRASLQHFVARSAPRQALRQTRHLGQKWWILVDFDGICLCYVYIYINNV